MFDPAAFGPAIQQRRRSLPAIRDQRHPASHGPRLFADSADIHDIEPLYRAGIINGVTTNPTLMKRAGANSWAQAKAMLTDILTLLAPNPVSLELTELGYDAMLAQARELAALGSNAVIKVPVGGYRAVDAKADPFTGLKVIRALWELGIHTNATLVFNTTQAFWAANAGASCVSPFLGRVADYLAKHDDAGGPPGNSLYQATEPQRYHNTEYVACGGPRHDAGSRLVQEIVTVFAHYDIRTEVLAASIRNPAQVSEMLLAGADIVTVPAAILAGVADHPLTDLGMQAFCADAAVFTG
ncbi:transaldolase family protein [Immundisolibacter sp.]|uniref:transaldolase family protein n=1 Tax=Immundisolibacter sp. TaxID=1934948 RepID=UPI002635EB3A|nr:transaldolase family protein [Immundisolibacter sp.]MDD3651785.1 transaldolase family protein [Immundisolibacter sp.]